MVPLPGVAPVDGLNGRRWGARSGGARAVALPCDGGEVDGREALEPGEERGFRKGALARVIFDRLGAVVGLRAAGCLSVSVCVLQQPLQLFERERRLRRSAAA